MSINKVILVGNLTRDAQVRTVGQNQVASFGLATSERFTDRNGQKQETSEFHEIELWGNLGVHPYLQKGAQVYIEGSIKTDKWTDQQGQPHERKKIRASQIQLLGQRPQPSQQVPPQAAPSYQPPMPQGYPGAPQYPSQQNYGPIAAPPQPARPQQPPMPPQPQYPPQPPMAQQLDPANYPCDLPFD